MHAHVRRDSPQFEYILYGRNDDDSTIKNFTIQLADEWHKMHVG